ncbi:glutamate--tRNA ligase [Candidatus Roizmanbacteria bacterium]|nr:glutamate--tRNA ligase [Candidatus Roizmanbacteria bacterium]
MTKQPNIVRTRIAPSPTGFPHIGTIYQVLFDYAFAKKHGGKFVCRIEDTDRARLVEGSEQVIYESLEWFGLNPDESPVKGGPYAPYRQSERLDTYKKYAEDLIKKGHAYYCFCTKERLGQLRAEQTKKKIPPMYDKHCVALSKELVEKNLKEHMPYVIRLNVPRDRKITFTDVIVGKIEFDSSVVDDQVLIKSDGFPTYHLAVVVDDHLMEISHIFRGREWISSTPKHVLLYEFFGWEMPVHGHFPLLLNADGKGKLSKRHGHASVNFYKEQGFLPDAILNFLSNIVWAHPEGKELYDLDEFIKLVDITKINSQGARFDLTKLEWMNGEYLRKLSVQNLLVKIKEYLKEFESKRHPELVSGSASEVLIEKTLPLVQTRIKKLSEYWPMCEFFFKRPTEYEKEINKEWMNKIVERLSLLSRWTHDAMYRELAELAQSFGSSKSKFFMDIRIAVTGKKVGPPLFESMEVLGKEESIERLKSASN